MDSAFCVVHFAFCVWQITPVKETVPEPESAASVQVEV